jgi:peptidoglycan LD-endopeptidase LytH
MIRRISSLAFFAIAAGCSQRSPWRVMPAPAPVQQAAAIGTPDASAPSATPLDSAAAAHLRALFFPIAGGDSTRLDDTFDEPRDGGARKHNAIDIMAPRGTPVLSVDDGRILRLSSSAKGGITIYATDLEERFVYYYAHLDRYYPSIYAGRPLLRGDTIGFVGTTGNAPKDAPHLHFQVMRMPADHRYWNGDPINPYPLLRQTASAPGTK